MKRLHIIYILLLFALAPLRAQEFLPIPAGDYPVGTLFTAQLRDARAAVLEYPEFVPLTRAEVRQVKALGLHLGEQPQPEFFVATERKRPVLEVTFLPLVKRGGKYYRVASVKITPVPDAARMPAAPARIASGAAASRYAAHSVLAEGRWVKIQVTQEGVYRLTAAQLATLGFSNPDRVRLYGYGGRPLPEAFNFSGTDALVDDLCEVPLRRTAGGLLFFAEGVTRWTWNASTAKYTHLQSPYATASCYFLTEGEPLAFPTLDEATGADVTLDAVPHHAVLDNDAYAWYGGGRNFQDAYDFATGRSHNFSLAAPGCVAGEAAKVDIAFTAAGQTSTTPVTYTLGGTTLGTVTIPMFGDNESARESVRSYNTTALTAANTFGITTGGTNPARLDYIRATYTMRLDATLGGTSFSPCRSGAVTLRVANATAQTELWRVGDAGTPTARVPATLDGTTLTATVADGLARYVIVSPDAQYAAPTSLGTVPNQDLHGDPSAYDMVIILAPSAKLQEQAERIAALHTDSDGLRVKIVRADLLYNEFSSGTPDAAAYRRYVKMLYDRAATEADAPRYLLLFGDCFYDNRGVTPEGARLDRNDFLLSFEPGMGAVSDFSIGTLASYVTDDYFGLLDDGEGANITREKTDLAIGRIPTHDAATAARLVDKIVAYRQNATVGAWKNRLIFIGDDIDNNLHMRGAESALKCAEAVAGEVVVKRIYPDATRRKTDATGFTYPEATARIRQEMERGALMFNYTGHGGPSQISHAHIAGYQDFVDYAGTRPALWAFASCEITPYDQQEDDLGRAALFSQQGGAVALMCSARSVYASYNSALNDAFCTNLFSTDATGRRYTIGEALWLCKNSLVTTGRDATNNKLKYALLGDPALALAAPTATVVLDSINGQRLTATSFHTLRAGEVVRFSGHIEGASGFHGTVTATLFDRLETVTCLNNAKTADTPYTYTERTAQLYEGSDSVRAGKFSVEVVIPRAISYSDDAARLVLYAVSDDHTLEAHGDNTQFCLNGTAPTAEADTVGPVVVPYLGDPDFVQGGTVAGDVVLGATVSDDSGINTTSGSVGHDIELVIDGNTADTRVLNDYFQYDFGTYRSGTIAYPLTGLTEGRHTLTLRVWDVFDNSTTATLAFNVRGGAGSGLSVYPASNPARTTTRL
ncbi:MAG: type IX secretion system sortase PorU, partial [Bacteroidaceae bacterium]|nr:type IX secretion system sortase PorU [Bacteroidaceae bacterium]